MKIMLLLWEVSFKLKFLDFLAENKTGVLCVVVMMYCTGKKNIGETQLSTYRLGKQTELQSGQIISVRQGLI